MRALIFSIALLAVMATGSAYGQCKECTTAYSGTVFSSPAADASWTDVAPAGDINSGQYLYFNVVAGTYYEWTTCGSVDPEFNTELTLLKATAPNTYSCTYTPVDALSGKLNGANVAFNSYVGDCVNGGIHLARVGWYADFTGTVVLLLNRPYCQTTNVTPSHIIVKWHTLTTPPEACTNCTQYLPSFEQTNPVEKPNWTTVSTTVSGGDYTLFNVAKGVYYEWSTCAGNTFDTQITLRRNSCGGELLGYNNDYTSDALCGTRSRLGWFADFSGTVSALVTQHYCANNTQADMTLQWRKFPVVSQCSNCTTLKGTYNANSTNVTTINDGQYIRLEHVMGGATYEFSTCGAAFDTQLTLRGAHLLATPNCSSTFIAYNDNGDGSDTDGVVCGEGSKILWTAPSEFSDDTVLLSMNVFNCQATGAQQTLLKTKKIKSTRYSDLIPDPAYPTDIVVNDNTTNLFWVKGLQSGQNWVDALAYCSTLSYAGFNDWRLPNINELFSLVDFSIQNPSTAMPVVTTQDWFWSSNTYLGTTNPADRRFAWVNNLQDGRTYMDAKANFGGSPAVNMRYNADTLCVRDSGLIGIHFNFAKNNYNENEQPMDVTGWTCDKSFYSKTSNRNQSLPPIWVYITVSDAMGTQIGQTVLLRADQKLTADSVDNCGPNGSAGTAGYDFSYDLNDPGNKFEGETNNIRTVIRNYLTANLQTPAPGDPPDPLQPLTVAVYALPLINNPLGSPTYIPSTNKGDGVLLWTSPKYVSMFYDSSDFCGDGYLQKDPPVNETCDPVQACVHSTAQYDTDCAGMFDVFCEDDCTGAFGNCVWHCCGDGVVDTLFGETCEYDANCSTVDHTPLPPYYGTDTAACDTDCKSYLLTNCKWCGDGMVTNGEGCDGTTLNCSTLPHSPTYYITEDAPCRNIADAGDCSGYDVSDCKWCGDTLVTNGEICDGGVDCSTVTHDPAYYTGDTAGCNTTCTAQDNSQCKWCGDGIISNGEACDGNTVDCGDISIFPPYYTGNTATCLNVATPGDCSGYNVAACKWCGDSSITNGENCDNNTIGCDTLPHVPAYYNTDNANCRNVATSGNCTGFDPANCKWCGDTLITNGEICDTNAVNCQAISAIYYNTETVGCATDCAGYEDSSLLADLGINWANPTDWIESGPGTFSWDATENALKNVGYSTLRLATRVPINPAHQYYLTYEVMTRNHTAPNAQTFSAGALSYTAATGGTPLSTSRYFGDNAVRFTAGVWNTNRVNFSIGGAPRTGTSTNVDDLTTWHPATTYAEIYFVANYDNATSTQETYIRNLKFYEHACRWCGDRQVTNGENCDSTVYCIERAHSPAYYDDSMTATCTDCSVSNEIDCNFCGDGAVTDYVSRDAQLYLPLEENTGTTAYDLSGNSYNGTLVNGPTWTTGKFGNALRFDGVNDYVLLPASNTVVAGPAATLSAWVKSDASWNANARILTIHRGATAGAGLNLIINANRWASYANNGTLNAYLDSGVAVDTNWHHIVTTNDGTTHRIFVDGIERASQALGFITGTYQASIGHFDGTTAAYAWKGIIDEIKIYPRALTSNEIQRPTLSLSFDEGTGTTAYDRSGYDYNGTLVNGPAWTTTAKLGKALSFDGANDYVQLPASNLLVPGSAATLSAWVKSDASWNADARILTIHRGATAGAGLNLIIRTNRWASYANNGTLNAFLDSGVAVDDKWHHIATTNDGTTHRIFVDGIERASQSLGFIAGTYQASIGHFDGTTATYAWKGIIDEARIYPRALTAAEIRYYDPRELCDTAGNAASKNCKAFGSQYYDAVTVPCKTGCLDYEAPTNCKYCGNNTIDSRGTGETPPLPATEACDPPVNCVRAPTDYFFAPPTVADRSCSANCTVDAACVWRYCGDNVIDEFDGEECDGGAGGGKCSLMPHDPDYYDGDGKVCQSDCKGFTGFGCDFCGDTKLNAVFTFHGDTYHEQCEFDFLKHSATKCFDVPDLYQPHAPNLYYNNGKTIKGCKYPTSHHTDPATDCRITDDSDCRWCGDGKYGPTLIPAEPAYGEACDTVGATATVNCATRSHTPSYWNTGDNATCLTTCLGYDETACKYCGDQLVTAPQETCDTAKTGGALGAATVDCNTYDSNWYAGANATCKAGCDTGYNTTACRWCGDTTVSNGESCDTARFDGLLGSATVNCSVYNAAWYNSHDATCKTGCFSGYDTTACTYCNDSVVTDGETCDTTGATATVVCNTRPHAPVYYNTENATCKAGCFSGYNETSCQYCGNGGTPSNGEVCDNDTQNCQTLDPKYYNTESADCRNRMRLWYSLDENTGAAANDTSGYSNHGTISGATWTAGKIGSALNFDGVNDYVNAGSTGNIGIADELSVFAWIKVPASVPAATRVGNIIGNYPASPHFNFEGHTSGRLRVYWNGLIDLYSTGVDLRDDVWHLVGFTRSVKANKIQIYVDGVPNASAAASSNLTLSWPLRIGDDFRVAPSIPFRGAIDEVRLYPRALTDAEITDAYSGTSYGTATCGGYDTSFCKFCGDTLQTNSEVCDTARTGSALGAATVDCKTYNGTYYAGSNATCKTGVGACASYVTTDCRWCGDNSYSPEAPFLETCDTVLDNSNYGAKTIACNVYNPSYYTGFGEIATCIAGCMSSYNLSACDWCGDGIVQDGIPAGEHNHGEVCDTGGSGGSTGCENISHSPGYYSVGIVNCNSDCKGYADATCKFCGDGGAVDAGEVCDRGTKNCNAISTSYYATETVPCRNTMAAWYNLDEGTLTAANDTSGNGNTGTLTNGPAWTTSGKFDKALSFDGVNDYINVPSTASLKPTTGITVDAWINPSLQGTREFIATKWNGFSLELTTANTATFNVYVDGGQRVTPPTGVLPNNTWTRLTGTYDAKSKMLKIYVNGNAEIKTTTLAALSTYDMTVSDSALTIGVYGGMYYNGLIDEVRIYPRALTAAEIADPTGGDLTCAGYDVSGCRYCGDGLKTNSEACDPNDPVTQTIACNTLDSSWYAGPVATCKADCSGYITSACRYCGDSIYSNEVPYSESCDTVLNTGVYGAKTIDCDVYSPANYKGDNATCNTTCKAGYATTDCKFCGDGITTDRASTVVSGTMMHLPMEDGISPTADASGNGRTGTLSGPVWTTKGKFGKALSFDGVNDYVYVTNSTALNPGANMTMMAWIYWKGGAGDHNFITKENAFEIRVNGGYVSFAANPWAWIGGTSAPILQNTWTHVAMVHVGAGTQKIYINGVEKFSGASGGSIASNAEPVTVGARSGGAASFFNGLIDEVKIFNRALAPDEIMEKVLELHLDEGTATSAYDSSGYNNTGTLTNSPTWTNDAKIGKALSFDGVNDYVNTGVDISWNNTNSGSISFWVKPQNITDTNRTLMGKMSPDYEWAFYQNGASAGYVYWDSAGGHTNGMADAAAWPNVLTAGTWTLLTYTWDGGTSRFYANASLVNTLTATNPSANMNRTNSVVIGGHAYVWADTYFKGIIDEVKIYKRALTSGEVTALYMQPLTVDAYEGCDNGSANNSDTMCGYAIAFTDCSKCHAACQGSYQGAQWCGDGIIQTVAPAAEACDNGVTNSNTPCAYQHDPYACASGCSATCTVAGLAQYCGDGTVQIAPAVPGAAEICDINKTGSAFGAATIDCTTYNATYYNTGDTATCQTSASPGYGATDCLGYNITNCKYCGDGNINAIATTTNLVMRLNFDESSGATTAYDSSPLQRNHASIVGVPWTNDVPNSKYLYAHNYTGTTTYAYVYDNYSDLTLGTVWTLEAWVKYGTSTRQRILGKGAWQSANYTLNVEDGTTGYGTAGHLLCVFDSVSAGGGMGVHTPLSYADNQWHYVACTYDGANLRIYVDGYQKDVKPYTGTPKTDASPFYVGGNHDMGYAYYTGKVDEVRIYKNTALTAPQIQQNWDRRNYHESCDQGASNGCGTCTTSCTPKAANTCGDGTICGTEQCEGTTYKNNETCATYGYDQGSLSCSGCAIVTSACYKCGDGSITGSEVCDTNGPKLNGNNCSTASCGTPYSTTYTTTGSNTLAITETATYRIEVWGAQGGSASSGGAGGLGARMRGDFYLTNGTSLKILVGAQGGTGNTGGGGGGSFVTKSDNTPLIIAGGGGGGYRTTYSTNSTYAGATTSPSGNRGANGNYSNRWGGAGGTAGNGGLADTLQGGAGGAGGGLSTAGQNGTDYYGSGAGYYSIGGAAFTSGGAGGAASTCDGSAGAGGVGSGGGGNWCGYGGAGGGGGYSGGGGGGNFGVGGGGGSYNAGSNQSNTAATWSGNGKVTITKICYSGEGSLGCASGCKSFITSSCCAPNYYSNSGTCTYCNSTSKCGATCSACSGTTPVCIDSGTSSRCGCNSNSDCDSGYRCNPSKVCESTCGKFPTKFTWYTYDNNAKTWTYNPTTDHCYAYVGTASYYWTEANIECQNASGYLATFSNAAEATFGNSLCSSWNVWVGGTKASGSWAWVDGTAWWGGWNAGEPNGSGSYTQMYSSSLLDDTASSNNKTFLCEGNP